MKNKEFDCVEMKHQAAEKIYQKIMTMTLEEELAFWNSNSSDLQKTYTNEIPQNDTDENNFIKV